MRLLIGYAIVCVLVAGAVAYSLLSSGRERKVPQSPPTATTTPPIRDTLHDDHQASAAKSPLAAPVAQPDVESPTVAAREAETVAEETANADPLVPTIPPATQDTREFVAATSHPVAEPPERPQVHWASDLRTRRALRRFGELREVIASDPYNEAALDEALTLAREFDWQAEVPDLLARLVALEPDSGARRYEYAVELLRQRRWIDALPEWGRLVQDRPQDPRVWHNLAATQQALGHLADAQRSWNRVIQLVPENTDAYVYRGEVRLDLHEWSAAVADFERVLADEPGALDARLNAAHGLAKLGHLDEARDYVRTAIEEHPHNVAALNRAAELAATIFFWNPHEHAPFADEALAYAQQSLDIVADQAALDELIEEITLALESEAGD